MSDYKSDKTTDAIPEYMTLKALVEKIKLYAIEVKKNWLIVALCLGFSLAIMIYQYFSSPQKYTATLTFMVNEKEGGGLGGAASILGALGAGADSKNNLDKILTLSKSMRIIREVLFSRQTVDDKQDFLANHIIEQYENRNDIWKKSLFLKGFRFNKKNYSSEIDSLEDRERLVLKILYDKIVGTVVESGLMSNNQSRQTQIMSINITSTSDDLSIVLSKTIFQRLSQFYIDKTIEREKKTFTLVREKVDSIRQLMIGSDYANAKFEDSNRGLVMERLKVPIKQLSRNSNILTVMYAEAIKNLEISDFTLKNNTPFVQPIDIPFSPLREDSVSLKKTICISLVVGLIIGIFFIVIRKLIKDSLI